MGIFTTYIAYKIGKSRAERKMAQLEEDISEMCVTCGYERRHHIDNDNEDCPVQ
jgi:hypothetical protein